MWIQSFIFKHKYDNDARGASNSDEGSVGLMMHMVEKITI